MTTLAARVLEAIEAAEQLAKATHPHGDNWAHEESWHTLRCGADWGSQNSECACPVPAAILRRCAADRKILARCEAVQGGGYWEYGDAPILGRAVLIALAEGYGVPLEQEET